MTTALARANTSLDTYLENGFEEDGNVAGQSASGAGRVSA